MTRSGQTGEEVRSGVRDGSCMHIMIARSERLSKVVEALHPVWINPPLLNHSHRGERRSSRCPVHAMLSSC